MRHGALLNGIGGFQLAASWLEWQNVFHCEIDKFCNKVVKQHFPNSICYEDIKTTDFTIWRGKIDILTGGFPCQPFSVAGKRGGADDDRYLWPEMLRAIKEIQPAWIVPENVPGIITIESGLVFERVCAEMEAEGYEVQPLIIPACATGAPHKRDRVWFIAHRVSNGRNGYTIVKKNNNRQFQERMEKGYEFDALSNNGFTSNPDSDQRCEGRMHQTGSETTKRYVSPRNASGYEGIAWDNFPTQSPVCGRNDGIPDRVDRIKALGNAIVPQVAYEIFKAIEKANQ